MKMQDVRAMAKRMGIKSFGKSKGELIREIQRAEGNFDCYGTATDFCDQLDCLFRSSCLNKQKKSGQAT
ncbi:MAG: SAP domain-containing protein [Deltaproteobacteria bacterium]|nr:SAP domain-containing protein [Deltaproteobacteria bacterium]